MAVSGVYAVMETLWTRQPTMLVYMKMYEGKLVNADPTSVGTGAPEINAWARQPDDHHYQVAIILNTMNQIDQGVLRINMTVPTYLDINISKVEIVKTRFDANLGYWLPFITVETLATNVPLLTEITFAKANALWVQGNEGTFGELVRRDAIIVTLSEYQIASSEGLPSLELPTTIDLGVQNY